jgi:hypothetical protein
MASAPKAVPRIGSFEREIRLGADRGLQNDRPRESYRRRKEKGTKAVGSRWQAMSERYFPLTKEVTGKALIWIPHQGSAGPSRFQKKDEGRGTIGVGDAWVRHNYGRRRSHPRDWRLFD